MAFKEKDNTSYEIFRYATFDVQALCQLARNLRQGKKSCCCTCDVNQPPAGGSFNWAIFLSFDDGVEWVFRSPRTTCTNGAIRCEETHSTLLASEAATLKFLKANSEIPVPEVYAYSSSGANNIGIPYILMSKAPGFSLDKVWNATGKAQLSVERKAKVLSQLGSITWQLSQLRFNQIGSLFEDQAGNFVVKECLSRGLTMHERHSIEDLPRGPFDSEQTYYESLIQAFIEQAEYLPLHQHCFVAPIPSRKDYETDAQYLKACNMWNDFVILGSKIESSDNRLDYIIVGDVLAEIRALWKKALPRDIQQYCDKVFSLHHADLSVNNIFVDDDYNITSIIDWAFCSSVPLPVLLMAPGLPQSRCELEQPCLITAFENGFESAAMHEEQHKKAKNVEEMENALAPMMRLLQNNRFTWLLTRLLNFDSTDDYSLFHSLWEIVHPSGRDLSEFIESQRSSLPYIERYNQLRIDDEPIERTRKVEKEYFRKDTAGIALARKLTVVSQWANQYSDKQKDFEHLNWGIRRHGKIFVADAKLWKWIIKSQEET